MNIPGLADWRTTIPALVTAFFGFVLFSPELFPPALTKIAAYIAAGGLAVFGINAASNAKVKEKTNEQTDRKLRAAGLRPPPIADDEDDD